MRPLFVLLLMLFIVPTAAQSDPTFPCDNESTTSDGFRSQVSLELVDFVDTEPFDDHRVNLMVQGLHGFDPVIGHEASDQEPYCIFANNFPYYELSENGESLLGEYSAESFIDAATDPVLHIGEVSDTPGEFLLFIERPFVERNSHQYSLDITPEMIGSGVSLAATVFSLPDEPLPELSLSSPEGSVQAQPEPNAALYIHRRGESRSAATLPLPQTPGNVILTVDRGRSSGYVLVLHLASGQRPVGDGSASASQDDEGAFLLSCDETLVAENAVALRLPDDGEEYLLTALGAEAYDPVLAVVDAQREGICYDNTGAARLFAVDLPTLTATASTFSAQGRAAPDQREAVVASRDGFPGELLLIVDGGQVQAEDGGDTFQLVVTPGMVSAFDFITVYVFAADSALDPALAFAPSVAQEYLQTDETLFCDDAGFPDSCWGASERLDESSITLETGSGLRGFSTNAMLRLPIEETMLNQWLPLSVSADEGSAGAYLLLLHLVTD